MSRQQKLASMADSHWRSRAEQLRAAIDYALSGDIEEGDGLLWLRLWIAGDADANGELETWRKERGR